MLRLFPSYLHHQPDWEASKVEMQDQVIDYEEQYEAWDNSLSCKYIILYNGRPYETSEKVYQLRQRTKHTTLFEELESKEFNNFGTCAWALC